MHTLEQLRAGELAGTRHLKLACGLSRFPREVLELADTLEVLDLSGNALVELPADFSRLTRLRIFFCSENAFTELPEVLGLCPELSMVGFKANRIRKVSPAALPARLRWLILTDNIIEELPGEIGGCAQLQKLMLAGNRLRGLPGSLAQCRNLELIRIAANQLTELPAWLLSLPRLAWLAYSGNPVSAQWEARALACAPTAEAHWDHLTMEQQLGAGASGVTHRASYGSPGRDEAQVAVKVFKGALTSDGLPQWEMTAALCAGTHAHIIEVLARVTGHPAGSSGLVMELIDAGFTSLAGPPSLESCTRDIYPAASHFEWPVVLRMAQGIAAAARHLHRLGIMHGDLYAHNILHTEQGRVVIGDFGAASFYPTTDRGLAEALERLEVRAFGVLLEELLARCTTPLQSADGLARLHALKVACLSEHTAERPLFAQVDELLIEMGRCHESVT